jgi:NDP-sugar pyrophosphorylase family protein
LGSGQRFGIEIFYSEEPTILGTGGGLKRVERFFADECFLVVNADILTAFDANAVIQAHLAKRPLATLVVRRDPDVAGYGALGVDGSGRIRRFLGRGLQSSSPLEDVMFTGIHVIEPRVFADIPANTFSPITDAYIAMVERGDPIQGLLTDAQWIDIGTPERYREAERLVAEGLIPTPANQPSR